MRPLTLPVLPLPGAAKELLAGSLAVRLPLPGVTKRAERVMDLMQAAVGFLRELQPDRQDGYMLLRPPFDRPEDCDDGWIVRRGKDDERSALRDEKVYFHYRPLLRRWLSEKRGLDAEWFRRLLDETECLRTNALQLALAFARSIDAALGHRCRVADRLLAERNEFVIRVLQYLGQGGKDRLGNRHWDKSLFTLQLGQSIDGLVLIDPISSEPCLVESVPDTVVVFFGKQSRLLLGELVPAVEPIEHYIQDRRTPGDERMRNGIVGFAHVLPAAEVVQIAGNTPY